MGLVKASIGAIGGSFADQWKDFHTVPQGLAQTAAVFPAVRTGSNAGRGSNTRASDAIITNGSQIVIPEGYCLITFQEGELTSVVAEPGAYVWNTDDPVSQSVFSGDGLVSPLLKQSWERFKFGGRPAAQQIALFVSLKELPNNKFGTQSAVYWDDGYLNAQVGAVTRGTFTLRITDPVLFVKTLLPAPFLQNGEIFDFTDSENQIANQLFSEVVASLASAFSIYTNDATKLNRITSIQRDSVGFSSALWSAVNGAFLWESERGIAIRKVAILGIDYDEQTLELLKTVQRADALSGARGNSNLQASVASGIESAGTVDGAVGIVGLGVAVGGLGISQLQQPVANSSEDVNRPDSNSQSIEGDLVTRLEQLNRARDAGLITQEEFDSARTRALGL